jgi:hypothetical protein
MNCSKGPDDVRARYAMLHIWIFFNVAIIVVNQEIVVSYLPINSYSYDNEHYAKQELVAHVCWPHGFADKKPGTCFGIKLTR